MIKKYITAKNISETIVFFPLKSHLLKLPEDYYDIKFKGIFELLENTYNNTMNCEEDIHYEELYQDIQDVCKNNLDERLYNDLYEYYEKLLLKSLASLKQMEGSSMLDGAEKLWNMLFGSLKRLGKLFRYFESKNLSTKKHNNYEAFVVSILKSLFLKNTEIIKQIVNLSIAQIKLLRDDEPINVSQIKGILDMLLAINMYKLPFEEEFLKNSTDYYKSEAQRFMQGFDLRKYLAHVERRFDQETQLINKIIDKSSGKSLMTIVETCLITDNISKLMESDLELLVSSKDFQNLSLLYKFLARVDKIDVFRKRWNSLIKDKGNIIINNAEDNIIEAILALKVDLEKIVQISFENSDLLKNSMALAFDTFINSKTNLIAELTTKYIDNRLRKSEKMIVDDKEVEKVLLEYLDIFKYLSSKDVFEAFYTKRLVKRLLLGQMRSPELEDIIIRKLKEECGPPYTKKIEEIFKDCEISKELNKEFANYLKTENTAFPNIEFYMTVLHSNSWPLGNLTIPRFSEPFKKIHDIFTEFYLKKNSGVVLFWQFETSFCEVKARYGEIRYILQVSILQTFVLMIFNNQNEATFSEILSLTQIEAEELKKTLFSLYFMKEKLLVKSGADQKAIKDEDSFSVNPNYSSKLIKVKVNSIQRKETKEEVESTTSKVLNERQFLIDACIVRIMKMQKTISHNELIVEIKKELALGISDNDIKKRIESLIGRDYMKRDKEEKNKYHYVA